MIKGAFLAMAVALPVAAAEPAPNWTLPAAPQAGAAPAEAAQKPAQAVIHFARRGGISNWLIADEKTVFIQGVDRQWYKADLMSACIGLRFAQRIGFTFEVNGDFDKFSAIRYDRRTCPLTSLVKVDPPPGQKGKIAPKTSATMDYVGPAQQAATPEHP